MNAKGHNAGKDVRQKDAEGKPPGGDNPSRAPMPPAGPHAEPHLVNPEATPGTGSLASTDHDDVETDPGGG
jgi:hypothetical protein